MFRRMLMLNRSQNLLVRSSIDVHLPQLFPLSFSRAQKIHVVAAALSILHIRSHSKQGISFSEYVPPSAPSKVQRFKVTIARRILAVIVGRDAKFPCRIWCFYSTCLAEVCKSFCAEILPACNKQETSLSDILGVEWRAWSLYMRRVQHKF